MRLLADLMMTDMERSGMEVVIKDALANILVEFFLYSAIHWKTRHDRHGAKRNGGCVLDSQ